MIHFLQINKICYDIFYISYAFGVFCGVTVVTCKGTEKSSSHGGLIELITVSAAPDDTKSRIQVSSVPAASSK